MFGDMAWVTLKMFVDEAMEPLLEIDICVFHNGQCLMVYYHSSS